MTNKKKAAIVMTEELAKYILPEDLLKYFNITEVKEIEDPQDQTVAIGVYIEEKNILPEGLKAEDYESKGFYPEKRIQDFPIRGKALFIFIKRRRWRNKKNKNEVVSNDYSFIAKGVKLTQELSDFLKSTGRDPGRYD